MLFAKLDADADVYGVTLDRAGKPVACTCRGFSAKKTCKHCDCAGQLIADGLLPVPVRPTIAPSTWKMVNSPDLDQF